MASRIVISEEGELLDQLIRRVDTLSPGRVEATLAGNRGLADYGARLPAGLNIVLDDAPPAVSAVGTINLWD